MSNDTQGAVAETKRITLGLVLSWVFSVLFGVTGLVWLFDGQPTTGVFFILAAAVLFPPLIKWVEQRFKFTLSGMLRTIITVVLIIIGGTQFSDSPSVALSKINGTPPQSIPAASESGTNATQVQAAPEKPVSTPAATESQPAPAPAAPASTPAPAPAAMQTLLNISGSGTKTTESFTAAGSWNLIWSYDCSNFGDQGNFQVTAYDPSGQPDFNINPVNELGASGSDTEYYHQGGTYYLEVNSECNWTLKVEG